MCLWCLVEWEAVLLSLLDVKLDIALLLNELLLVLMLRQTNYRCIPGSPAYAVCAMVGD